MRIDKYLKVSRILKRRTISKELAVNDRIEINHRKVKPAHEVKEGDIVTITFGNRQLEIRVLSTVDIKRKKDAVEMYEVIAERRIEEQNIADTSE